MRAIWAGSSNEAARNGIIAFVARQLDGASRGFGNCVCMGVLDDEILVAGMIFHNFSPENGTIELSGAATTKRWLTRSIYNEMFEYPFGQLGCQMLVARHSEHNRRLRRMWSAVGATEYIIPRLRGRDEAEAIATYTEEAWRNGRTMRRLTNG